MDVKDKKLKELQEALATAQDNLDEYLGVKTHRERYTAVSKFDKVSGRSYYEVTHKNRAQPIYIVPNPMGYNSWVFKCPQNRLPASLENNSFMRAQAAIDAVVELMDNMRPTAVAKKKLKEEV